MYKKFVLPFVILLVGLDGFAQGKVGINTSNPQAMLHVKDSSVLFSGNANLSNNPGNPPASGAGTRMMWYADKAAFRAGKVFDTESANWDKDSIGVFSVAMGLNTKAKGAVAVVLGGSASASGDFSVAIGAGTTASGFGSVAMGFSSTASGSGSVAMNSNSIALGTSATAMGITTTAQSYGSFAAGQYNDPIGSSNLTSSVPTDPLFILGNGTNSSNTRNALIITKNAKTGINVANGLPQAMLHIKAADATIDRHIKLEAFNSTNSANIYYNNDLNFRNNTPGGDFYFVNDAGTGVVAVTSTGTIGLTGEINNTATGTANLVPIAYGSIALDGTINSGTGNFTVSKPLTGQYEISLTGISYTTSGFICNVTPRAGDAVIRVPVTTNINGALVVRFYNLSSTKSDSDFHFVVYRP